MQHDDNKIKLQILLKRYDKACKYFDNPEIPQDEKDKYFNEFTKILKQINDITSRGQ